MTWHANYYINVNNEEGVSIYYHYKQKSKLDLKFLNIIKCVNIVTLLCRECVVFFSRMSIIYLPSVMEKRYAKKQLFRKFLSDLFLKNRRIFLWKIAYLSPDEVLFFYY